MDTGLLTVMHILTREIHSHYASLVFVVLALMNILSSGLFENGETNILEALISMEL